MSFVIKQPCKAACMLSCDVCPTHNVPHEIFKYPLYYDVCYSLEIYLHSFETINNVITWLIEGICDHSKLVMTLVLVHFLLVFVSEELICSCNKPLWFLFVFASKDPICSDIPATCSFHYFSQWYLFPDSKNLTNYLKKELGQGVKHCYNQVISHQDTLCSVLLWHFQTLFEFYYATIVTKLCDEKNCSQTGSKWPLECLPVNMLIVSSWERVQ